jgi:hypothetical protein
VILVNKYDIRSSAWRQVLCPRPFSRKLTSIPYTLLENVIEEETLPHYDPEHFYPVAIGDVYHDRYQVAGKLGYGAHSTNWLCKDLRYVSFAVTAGPSEHLTGQLLQR